MMGITLAVVLGTLALILSILCLVTGSRVARKYDLKRAFVADALTRKRLKDTTYTAFKFSKDRFKTEHSGDVLYYVQPENLFNTENYPELDVVCDLMAHDLEKEKADFDCIVGIPEAGSHLALLLARKSKKPFAVFGCEITPEGKIEHPYQTLVGYIMKRGQRALLFDDASVSGYALAEATLQLRSAGIIVQDAYVFLDKQEGAAENLMKIGVRLRHFMTATDLINILRMQHRINDEAYWMMMNDMSARRKTNAKRVDDMLASNRPVVMHQAES